MSFSVSDVFRIGIGPSSSHTVGPMLAVSRFLADSMERLMDAERVQVDLYGSLALTGAGHGTDTAVLLGLLGELPHLVEPLTAAARADHVRCSGRLRIGKIKDINFQFDRDFLFHKKESLPQHPNGMRFTLYDGNKTPIATRCYFSIGGGTVLDEVEIMEGATTPAEADESSPLRSAAALLKHCNDRSCDIAEIVWANELRYRTAEEARNNLHDIWQVMQNSVERGLTAEGCLPGGLWLKRRAPTLYAQAGVGKEGTLGSDFLMMDLVSAFAVAVSEENACGARVVTAPTNGSAGVIPAVLSYFMRYAKKDAMEMVHRFLLTAAGIGMLYKRNASVSAAEMGCQGEIGVSSSMAAAGLAAVLGGTPQQVGNAAEIAMEHFLGMTCDPLNGLVQVPCIERNSMGAIKAIAAARMALMSNGDHLVSLDEVIETMRQTGCDMQRKYKETSLGGLAVNVVIC
nr:L-serine ammonia-lyase [uncultured Noviherbaspirillum sp.]